MPENKQPGIIPPDKLLISPETLKEIERTTCAMIDIKRRRINRMRWAVGAAWLLLAAVFITGGLAESVLGAGATASTLAITARALLIISLVLTVAWYVRSVSLRFEIIQQGLAAIQNRLDKQL